MYLVDVSNFPINEDRTFAPRRGAKGGALTGKLFRDFHPWFAFVPAYSRLGSLATLFQRIAVINDLAASGIHQWPLWRASGCGCV